MIRREGTLLVDGDIVLADRSDCLDTDDLPAPDWHQHTDGDICRTCGARLGWGSGVTA